MLKVTNTVTLCSGNITLWLHIGLSAFIGDLLLSQLVFLLPHVSLFGKVKVRLQNTSYLG